MRVLRQGIGFSDSLLFANTVSQKYFINGWYILKTFSSALWEICKATKLWIMNFKPLVSICTLFLFQMYLPHIMALCFGWNGVVTAKHFLDLALYWWQHQWNEKLNPYDSNFDKQFAAGKTVQAHHPKQTNKIFSILPHSG